MAAKKSTEGPTLEEMRAALAEAEATHGKEQMRRLQLREERSHVFRVEFVRAWLASPRPESPRRRKVRIMTALKAGIDAGVKTYIDELSAAEIDRARQSLARHYAAAIGLPPHMVPESTVGALLMPLFGRPNGETGAAFGSVALADEFIRHEVADRVDAWEQAHADELDAFSGKDEPAPDFDPIEAGRRSEVSRVTASNGNVYEVTRCLETGETLGKKLIGQGKSVNGAITDPKQIRAAAARVR